MPRSVPRDAGPRGSPSGDRTFWPFCVRQWARSQATTAATTTEPGGSGPNRCVEVRERVQRATLRQRPGPQQGQPDDRSTPRRGRPTTPPSGARPAGGTPPHTSASPIAQPMNPRSRAARRRGRPGQHERTAARRRPRRGPPRRHGSPAAGAARRRRRVPARPAGRVAAGTARPAPDRVRGRGRRRCLALLRRSSARSYAPGTSGRYPRRREPSLARPAAAQPRGRVPRTAPRASGRTGRRLAARALEVAIDARPDDPRPLRRARPPQPAPRRRGPHRPARAVRRRRTTPTGSRSSPTRPRPCTGAAASRMDDVVAHDRRPPSRRGAC